MDWFRSLLLKALDIVEGALDKGDAKIALELLKMAGLDMNSEGCLGTYVVGYTEADAIIEVVANEG